MLDMILNAIIPVFFVMGLGYLAGWTRDIDNHHVAKLNALVMDFAVPASLFVATVQTPRTLLLQEGRLILVLALSMLVIYGIVFWLQRSLFTFDTRQAAVGSLTVAFPNLASAGLPLMSSVFGAGHNPKNADGRFFRRRCQGRSSCKSSMSSIVGGGSASAVLAARLSTDAQRRVLLLEAEQNFAPDSYPLVLKNANIVAGSPTFDWQYHTQDAARFGRDIPVRRGRVIGGSSGAVRRELGPRKCH
jgi:hypothetical protein